MRNLIALTLAMSVGACSGAATDPRPTYGGDVYQAVLEAVSDDLGAVPLVHPGTIRVDSTHGAYPGHLAEHYDLGESVHEAMGAGDVVFCTERDDGRGCDVEEGSWLVFSKVAGTLEHPILWATLVEDSPRGRSLLYYRADVTEDEGRFQVDLNLLAIEN